MTYYYNPITRPDFAKATIEGEHIIEQDSPFYKLRAQRAYWTRADALASEFSGPVCFYEGGQLYMGHKVSVTDCKPLGDEPVIETGINWATAYFTSLNMAKDFERRLRTRHDKIVYHRDADVLSIHYHLYDTLGQYLQK